MQITRELIHQVEASSAMEGVAFARAMGAPHEKLGKGALVCFGPGRFVNRAVGLSLHAFDESDLVHMEAFFEANGVRPAIEVATGAPSELRAMLTSNGYEATWSRAVHGLELGDLADVSQNPLAAGATIEAVVDPAEWIDLIADGNEVTDPKIRLASDEMAQAAFSLDEAETYILLLDGVPAGCGSFQIVGDVAWVGGAATLPRFRGQGVQAALLAHRLRRCSERAVEIAAATSVPDSGSSRNLVRAGFTEMYRQDVFEKN